MLKNSFLFLALSLTIHLVFWVTSFSRPLPNKARVKTVEVVLTKNTAPKKPKPSSKKATVKKSRKPSNLKKGKPLLSYEEKLYAFVKSKITYPPLAKKLSLEGTVVAHLQVSPEGKIKLVDGMVKSRHKTLSAATKKSIENLPLFEPPPVELASKTKFYLPIHYKIK